MQKHCEKNTALVSAVRIIMCIYKSNKLQKLAVNKDIVNILVIVRRLCTCLRCLNEHLDILLHRHAGGIHSEVLDLLIFIFNVCDAGFLLSTWPLYISTSVFSNV